MLDKVSSFLGRAHKKYRYIRARQSIFQVITDLNGQINRTSCSSTPTNRCIIYTSVALNYVHIKSEILFGQCLVENGWDVIYVFCNGLYDSCEFSLPSDHIDARGSNCNKCSKLAASILASLPSSSISLKDVPLCASDECQLNRLLEDIKNKTKDEISKLSLHGIGIHEHVLSTYCRQTLTSPSSLDQIPDSEYRRISANVTKAIVVANSLFRELKPSLFISTHGIYLNHGPVTSLASQLGISTTVWGVPYRLGSYFMTKDDTYHRSLLQLDSKRWISSLTTYEKALTSEYLLSKESGGRDYWHYSGTVSRSTSEQITNASQQYRHTYIAFTNVDWDAQIFYASNLFPTQLEWLEATINEVSNLKDTLLIIRIHPADSNIFKSRDSFSGKVKSIFNKAMPSNVVIIEPDDSISSYDLIRLSSMCIVYGSKISLECIFRGKPTVIAGNSLFKQPEFAYLPRSKDEYRDLLLSPPSVLPEQVEYSLQFAHYLYFRVFQDCHWADSLLEPTTDFHALTDHQRQSLYFTLVHGTN